MCHPGALSSRLERLTAGSGGCGDVSDGIDLGIVGRPRVAMTSDGVVMTVGAIGDREPCDGDW